MSMRTLRELLARTSTKLTSFGHLKFQIDVYSNDNGTYTFLKKYFSNGATILLAQNLTKLDAMILFKELKD